MSNTQELQKVALTLLQNGSQNLSPEDTAKLSIVLKLLGSTAPLQKAPEVIYSFHLSFSCFIHSTQDNF